MSLKIEIICPRCAGEDALVVTGKKEAARYLFAKGYGVRQIQRILGYKSPRSVQTILK